MLTDCIANGSSGGGPPDPSMICLYPQMLQAAADEKAKKEKAEQAARAHAQDEGRSGLPDPSMICLYPESLKAAQEGKK